MPIPDAKQAVVSESKICDYLLNFSHPDGGTKAAWFYSLGYRQEQWQELADDLLNVARQCQEFTTETSAYGVKYKAYGRIGRPGHRFGDVRTIWITEQDQPPRFVTAYPDSPS